MVSFIVFTVGEQKFVYETEKVVETVKVDRIFPVPKSPPYLRGVINLRNNVIPVLDTGKLLWDIPTDSDTLLIVSEQEGDIGLLVSKVVGIVSIDEEELKNAEGVDFENIKEEFIRGIVEKDDEILMLLNLKPVLEKRAVKGRRASKKKRHRVEGNSGVGREELEGYVIFNLGEEWFAIQVDKVKEVVDYPSTLAELPKSPDYVEGIFLLRKEELILYSLKKFIGVESDREERRVIVLEMGGRKFGVAVDDVREIRWVGRQAILPVEGVSSKGVIALEEGRRLVLILELDELSREETSREVVLEEKEAQMEVKPMRNFVRFSIDEIDMAIPIEKVKEVVELSSITSLPNSPDYVDGLYNLRNSVIVIISLCKRLGLSCNEDSGRVIVLEDFPVGLRVSNLKGIFKTEEENIQPAEGVSEPEEEFLEGIIKTTDGGIIFILSPDKIVKDEDVSLLEEGAEVEN